MHSYRGFGGVSQGHEYVYFIDEGPCLVRVFGESFCTEVNRVRSQIQMKRAEASPPREDGSTRATAHARLANWTCL